MRGPKKRTHCLLSFSLVSIHEWTKEKVAWLALFIAREEIISSSNKLSMTDDTVTVRVESLKGLLRLLLVDSQNVEVLDEFSRLYQTIVVGVNVGKVTIVNVVGSGQDDIFTLVLQVADERIRRGIFAIPLLEVLQPDLFVIVVSHLLCSLSSQMSDFNESFGNLHEVVCLNLAVLIHINTVEASSCLALPVRSKLGLTESSQQSMHDDR